MVWVTDSTYFGGDPQLEYQDGAKHLAERLKSIHDREGGAVNGGVEGVVIQMVRIPYHPWDWYI